MTATEAMAEHMADLAAASQEIPGFFPAAGETLFGVFAPAQGVALGLGVLLLPQQSILHSSSLAVRLARRLAGHGCDVLRFDLHGVGESTGTAHVQLDDPHVEDVLAAVSWMRRRGVRRFVLVGGCFGARSVLAAAPEVEGLEAVVCAAMPVGDAPSLQADRVGRLVKGGIKLSNLRTPEGRQALAQLLRSEIRWVSKRLRRGHRVLGRLLGGGGGRRAKRGSTPLVSPKVSEPLSALSRRGIPVLFLFGSEDLYYRHFQQALAAGLDRLVDVDRGPCELDVSLSGELHGFKTLAAQEHFVETVERWVVARTGSGNAS